MPELLWHTVEEGIKRPEDLGLLGLSYMKLQGPKDDLFLERPREHTFPRPKEMCGCEHH